MFPHLIFLQFYQLIFLIVLVCSKLIENYQSEYFTLATLFALSLLAFALNYFTK